ncbi:hypothetical protein JW865_08335 [Candidatus Bathyarchaeota archaeon]|nr:hypothetical protein [Candidatus Bathyarchaeota archaeon]
MSNYELTYPFHYANFFIPEFIIRMRRNREILEKPSPRQSINMGKILLPMYIRNGHLKFEDLIKAAVITSQVENQKIAEKTALEILTQVSEYEDEEGEPFDGDQLLSLLASKTKEVIVSPHGKGLEQTYHNTSRNNDVDQFVKLENKPDIGVGPGENRIVKLAAKTLKNELDEKMRKLLAYLLKERLLKLGRELERKDDWSKIASVRPFQPGEDPDSIDEDRSLENIIDLGRKIEEIRQDDFLMLKKKKKNRNIIYIQDISNTMFYDYEGINSINYSILSLIPLMWGLRNDKWGLILYESNSHIIKDLTDERDIEKILEELISMITMTTTQMEYHFRGTRDGPTWGGTIPNKSFEWAYDQLIEASDRSDRICFIFSDFVINEPGKESEESKKNYEIIKRMINENIKVFAGISPLAYKEIFRPYSVVAIDKLLKMGIPVIETYYPSVFLDKAHEWLNEISK